MQVASKLLFVDNEGSSVGDPSLTMVCCVSLQHPNTNTAVITVMTPQVQRMGGLAFLSGGAFSIVINYINREIYIYYPSSPTPYLFLGIAPSRFVASQDDPKSRKVSKPQKYNLTVNNSSSHMFLNSNCPCYDDGLLEMQIIPYFC